VFEYSSLEPGQIRALIALGLPVPEVGIDLAGEDGEVLVGGELVELAWRAQRVAVLNCEPPVALSGWHLLQVDDEMLRGSPS
jgi:hypothetical protein